jgi:hypothetical protein
VLLFFWPLDPPPPAPKSWIFTDFAPLGFVQVPLEEKI